jgi:hypothetical protein
MKNLLATVAGIFFLGFACADIYFKEEFSGMLFNF